MTRRFLRPIAFLMAFPGLSCAAQQQLYPGPARDPSVISTIQIDPDAERTKVLQIGEVKVRGKVWQVLPGEYRVVLEAKRRAPLHLGPPFIENQYVYVKAVCETTFEARAGQQYIVTSRGDFSGHGSRHGDRAHYSGEVAAWIENADAPGQRIAPSSCEVAAGDIFL